VSFWKNCAAIFAGSQKSEETPCPKCSGSLEGYTFQGVALDRCNTCEGIWLDKGELETIARKINRRSAWCLDRYADRQDVNRNRLSSIAVPLPRGSLSRWGFRCGGCGAFTAGAVSSGGEMSVLAWRAPPTCTLKVSGNLFLQRTDIFRDNFGFEKRGQLCIFFFFVLRSEDLAPDWHRSRAMPAYRPSAVD
jgi:Zn-finger nucleic acid-binding protein